MVITAWIHDESRLKGLLECHMGTRTVDCHIDTDPGLGLREEHPAYSSRLSDVTPWGAT